MQNYTFYIIFVAVVLCIFFIVVIIHYGKANLTVIIIGFGFIFLISGIVVCLYLINDLLNKLNDNTKQLEVDLSEIKINVDNIHTDLVGSSTLINDILFLNPTKGLGQNFEEVSKDSSENFSNKRIYPSNILTPSVQLLLDNLNKNKEEISQVQTNLENVSSDVKDNVVEALKTDTNLQNTLAASPALQEGIINSPALENAIANSESIMAAITSSPTLQEFLSTNPDVADAIANNSSLQQSILNAPEMVQQKVDLEAIRIAVEQVISTMDLTKGNVELLNEFLKFLDETLGIQDYDGNRIVFEGINIY
jgi:hypothetical protein